MMCTSVIPCLPSSLATSNNIMSIIMSIINVYLIYVLYFTSAFRKAMVKIFTNTCLCPLSCFNFTSLTLYFWLRITPLLTRHHTVKTR